MVSRARVCCGVIEEKSRAAKVACDGRFFRVVLLGLLLRIDCGIRSFEHLVVLGVGGERKIWLPWKLEESKGLVEAMDYIYFFFSLVF